MRISGSPRRTFWPVSTRRSMIFPGTRNVRSDSTRALTIPVKPRSEGTAGTTVAISTSFVSVGGSVADAKDLQPVRPKGPALMATDIAASIADLTIARLMTGALVTRHHVTRRAHREAIAAPSTGNPHPTVASGGMQ